MECPEIGLFQAFRAIFRSHEASICAEGNMANHDTTLDVCASSIFLKDANTTRLFAGSPHLQLSKPTLYAPQGKVGDGSIDKWV